MYSCIVHCRVRCKAVKSDSSKKKGPAIPLLHTLGVYQSIGEGAAQCCESDQQRWQLIHLPSLSHHLHWVKRASQDGAGLLDKFIKCQASACCQDSAAPADFSIENCWCHHRVIESSHECPLSFLSRWSLLWNLLYVAGCDQSSPVYCSCELPGTCKMSPFQCPFPRCSPVCSFVCAWRNPPPALLSSQCCSWRWFCFHQSLISSL